MRLQLQDNAQGENTYWTTVLTNSSRVGVTVIQVREGMRVMFDDVVANLVDKEFPDRLEFRLRSAIINVSQKLEAVRAGGGVTEIGNVGGLQETFYDRGLQYRIDLENLSGHNLRN